jgi:ATP-dependent DNA ligase
MHQTVSAPQSEATRFWADSRSRHGSTLTVVPPTYPPCWPRQASRPTWPAGWRSRSSTGGWRARILVDTDGLRVRTRSGRDITANAHGLELLTRSGLRAVLDGELVAGGRLSDFYLVGPTLARRRPAPGRTVAFAAFDLLWHDGQLTTSRPYSERVCQR